MTDIKTQAWQSLEKLGFVVKHFSDKQLVDAPNTFYYKKSKTIGEMQNYVEINGELCD